MRLCIALHVIKTDTCSFLKQFLLIFRTWLTGLFRLDQDGLASKSYAELKTMLWKHSGILLCDQM